LIYLIPISPIDAALFPCYLFPLFSVFYFAADLFSDAAQMFHFSFFEVIPNIMTKYSNNF